MAPAISNGPLESSLKRVATGGGCWVAEYICQLSSIIASSLTSNLAPARTGSESGLADQCTGDSADVCVSAGKTRVDKIAIAIPRFIPMEYTSGIHAVKQTIGMV